MPIWKLPDERRTVEVEAFEGKQVRVTYSAFRSTEGLETVEGELLGVATPLTGTQGNVRMAILRHQANRRIVAISLATINTIRERT